LDANVARVYRRVFNLPSEPRDLRHAAELREFAISALARKEVKQFNWALLDLGGTICTPQNPRCDVCPLATICVSHDAGACGCAGSRVTESGGNQLSKQRI
jgi:A/G-specific adenine glycosylase